MTRTWLLLGLLPRLAVADPITERCVGAHHEAQTARRDGHLGLAKTELATCAQAGCPQLIATDCQRWLGEVDALMPTVVLTARDPAGAPVAEAKLFVDGAAIAGGRALELDPGAHQFRAEAPGRLAQERLVTIAPGVRDQRVELELRPAPVPAPSGLPRPTAILGGVAILGVGVAAGFGSVGLVERNRLDDRHCSPNCPPDDVHTIRRNFAVADIALGVGVLAIAAAVIYYALDKPAKPGELLTLRF